MTTTPLSAGLLGAALLAAMAVPGMAAASDESPLAAYHWKARVLVAIAPNASDPRLARQRELFVGMKAGARERDLVLVEAIGTTPQATALRRSFDLGDGFQAVLVGKDGGAKLTSADPIDASQLFPLIDSMPMRRTEMKQP